MSLNKTTGKHRQTRGKKHSINFDDDIQSLFLTVKQTLEASTGKTLSNTDAFKWMVISEANRLEREIEHAQRQNR